MNRILAAQRERATREAKAAAESVKRKRDHSDSE
jgi:hypothetical protein